MNKPGYTTRITHSGFFVLRTPLLPFGVLETFGQGLTATANVGYDQGLSQALQNDRARVRLRLKSVLEQPEVREALFLGSPSVYAHLHHWLSHPETKLGRKLEKVLVRYLSRMAGRPTPFGTFAGCSVGKVGSRTDLCLEGRDQYRRHTRLDMEYVIELTKALERDPALRGFLRFRPNSSLYCLPGQMRYAEERMTDGRRTYHLVAVEATEYLETVLTRAREGASRQVLVDILVSADVTEDEAKQYIEELIESQILVSDLTPRLTGPEPMDGLLEELRRHEVGADVVLCLSKVRELLENENHGRLGRSPEWYINVSHELEELPASATLSRLFQVDLIKLSPDASLGPNVLADISKGVALLHAFSRTLDDPLARFRSAFSNRYGAREVALAEALDEELGIGFSFGNRHQKEMAPLLNGLVFPVTAQTASWSPRDGLLLRKLALALEQGADEISVEHRDVADLGDRSVPPLPDTFHAMAALAAESAEALNRGEYRIFIQSVAGPSGARLLGRFCHADDSLFRLVQHHLRREELLVPHAIYAEVVHNSEGRAGNILLRPILRDHEIPYLGRSGADARCQIPITDLLVSVQDGRLVLRSKLLGLQVIPRLSSAHNFVARGTPLYRFLCTLQLQGVASDLTWDWGPLSKAPFLPRVIRVPAAAIWRPPSVVQTGSVLVGREIVGIPLHLHLEGNR